MRVTPLAEGALLLFQEQLPVASASALLVPDVFFQTFTEHQEPRRNSTLCGILASRA